MNLDALIRQVQDAVGVTVDGKPGPATWEAIHTRLCPHQSVTQEQAKEDSPVDPRSEKNIATLHPKVQPYARALIHAALAKGWTFKVTSGLRSYAEQTALYQQGRTTAGKKVTNAPAGYSNHNFGMAFDVTLFSGSTPVYDSPLYKALATLGTDLGLECGGNWKTSTDEPHYQLRPTWAAGMPENVMLTELRRRQTAKLDFYA